MPAIMGGVQAAAGLAQSVIGGIRAAKAQKQLEGMTSPTYSPNASILDFYHKALARYGVSPYQSAAYRMSTQNSDRALQSGLSALRGRGGLASSVSALMQGKNDADLRAVATAEGLQNQALAQLGNAAGMKAAEDSKAFQINELDPFERKYQLTAMKASGGNQMLNAGLSNISGGANTYAEGAMLKQMYGSGGYGNYGYVRAMQNPAYQIGSNPDGSPHFN